jgi:hypothetical protein
LLNNHGSQTSKQKGWFINFSTKIGFMSLTRAQTLMGSVFLFIIYSITSSHGNYVKMTNPQNPFPKGSKILWPWGILWLWGPITFWKCNQLKHAMPFYYKSLSKVSSFQMGHGFCFKNIFNWSGKELSKHYMSSALCSNCYNYLETHLVYNYYIISCHVKMTWCNS